MEVKIYKFGWLVTLLFCLGISLYSQTKSDLEKKKTEALKDIELTQRLLDQAKVEKQTSLNNLVLLQKKIQIRENVISRIEEEISDLDKRISESNLLLQSLEADLRRIKEEYAHIIYYSYKHRSNYDRLMFILSANDFNQAYRRIRYLHEYSDYRKKQVRLIGAVQNVMASTIIDLENRKREKIALIQEKNIENVQLEREKESNDKIVAQLKKKEKELLAQLKEKKEIAEKLESEILKMIASEVKKKGSTESYFNLTPEEKIVDGDFKRNRGSLPWPTERGLITSYFGEHPHPVIKGVMVRNNGVDISSIPNAPVRALFDGEVTKIFAILGANYTVIIRHGSFLTVYQNLVNVTVKVGDKVKMKQPIGIAYTDKGSSSSLIHLEIWEELNKLNVHELRKLARSIENFPIKGREISKANRNTLLEFFGNL